MKAATPSHIPMMRPGRFQSTPPVKAATGDMDHSRGAQQISIHAAREGGDYKRLTPLNKEIISIHAAREGGDVTAKVETPETPEISIHAAREGGDRQICVIACDLGISIHAAREGGDPCLLQHRARTGDFNPRRP